MAYFITINRTSYFIGTVNALFDHLAIQFQKRPKSFGYNSTEGKIKHESSSPSFVEQVIRNSHAYNLINFKIMFSSLLSESSDRTSRLNRKKCCKMLQSYLLYQIIPYIATCIVQQKLAIVIIPSLYSSSL
ncbi:hypothetical protein EDC94DRAFT_585942 [Helicostylum pulchrum]|nr:hypothetical protein EDC94DRAFT_585942 [Helicostylum pulchrum]